MSFSRKLYELTPSSIAEEQKTKEEEELLKKQIKRHEEEILELKLRLPEHKLLEEDNAAVKFYAAYYLGLFQLNILESLNNKNKSTLIANLLGIGAENIRKRLSNTFLNDSKEKVIHDLSAVVELFEKLSLETPKQLYDDLLKLHKED